MNNNPLLVVFLDTDKAIEARDLPCRVEKRVLAPGVVSGLSGDVWALRDYADTHCVAYFASTQDLLFFAPRAVLGEAT